MRTYLYKLVPFIVLMVTSPVGISGGSGVGGLETDFTQLHLTLLEETITSKQDLSSLEPGLYLFVVKNDTDEKAEFAVHDLTTDKKLGKVKIKPGKTKKAKVKITKNGFKIQKNSETWHEYAVQ